MEKIDLCGIKRENIKRTLLAAASQERISRAEIAQKTGLSIMTVGKIADVLLAAGFVTEEKNHRAHAGRRAGLLTLRCDRYAIVFDLSERAFRMNIVDFGLLHTDSMKYTYNRHAYYDENLCLFLKSARSYLDRRTDISKSYGIGVSVPGIYDISDDRVLNAKITELAEIPIKATAERILGRDVTIIKRNVESAALSYASELPGRKNSVIAYMFIGESVDGAVYNRGEFIEGSHGYGCDIGRMMMRRGQTLEDRIKMCTNDIMIADEISSAIYNMIVMLDPDAFVIESGVLREPELFIDNIKSQLITDFGLPKERLPQIEICRRSFRHLSRGVAMALREMWIDSIL